MKTKYKLGTLVEVTGRGYQQINAIVITKNETKYSSDTGVEFSDNDVLSSFRPITTRTAGRKRKSKTTIQTAHTTEA